MHDTIRSSKFAPVRRIFAVMIAMLFLAGFQAAAADPKPRLVILTDIGGDPDDQQAMIRLMTYTCDVDIEGLIATSRMGHGLDVKPTLIQQIVNAYGQSRPNLLLHRSDFPTTAYLLSVIKSGNPVPGTNSLGAGKDTEGSNWIISTVDKADARPVNIAVWGGSTELAQALWRVRNDRTAAQLSAFISKLRVHVIGDQDNTAPWIRTNFTSLFYVHDLYEADRFQSPYRGMYLDGDTTVRNATWVSTNVVNNHGPMGALYPTWVSGSDGVKEGDTPSWFYFLPMGLQDPAHPTWGGWGGRFSGSGPLYRSDSLDTVGTSTTRRATVWRWRPAFQNDFAARMDWCVKPFNQANHRPQVVLNGDSSIKPVMINAAAGSSATLSANGSSDPDGNTLAYKWWVYREAGSYTGSVTISNAAAQQSSVVIPADAAGKTIHIILEVTDSGTPALTSYRRAVLNVTSTSNPAPVVNISSPVNGASFTAGQNISVTASASDSNGTVSKVEFFANNVKIGEDTTSPYAITWNSVAAGNYSLTAKATDNAGATAVSGAVNITVATVESGLITNVSAKNGKAYVKAALASGALAYIDRTTGVDTLPSGFAGHEYIRTANDDKLIVDNGFLTFNLSAPATVYIARDNRLPAVPSWMNTFAKSGESISIGGNAHSLFARNYAAGTVTIGGNEGISSSSNYIVIARPQSTTPFSVVINSVSTGKNYSVSNAAAGAVSYIDRSYTLSSLSSGLAGNTLIRTANDDKMITAASHLTFSVNGSATVYVCFDKRATALPAWLETWTLTGESVVTTDGSASPMKVYSKSVAAGSVALGGNFQSPAAGVSSHYLVIVKPAAASLAASRSSNEVALDAQVWISPGDSDGDGLTDAYELGNGLNSDSIDSNNNGVTDEDEFISDSGLTHFQRQLAQRTDPGNENENTSAAKTLMVSRFSARLSFVGARDTIQIRGAFPDVPASGAEPVRLTLGGATQSFTLNARGSGTTETDTLQLKIKRPSSRRGSNPASESATFTLKVRGAGWLGASSSLNETAPRNAAIDLPVAISFGANEYKRTVASTVKSVSKSAVKIAY